MVERGSGGGVSLSLSGSSVKRTWREGSLAGDPEGYIEKALEMGISFYWGPGGGLIYQGLRCGHLSPWGPLFLRETWYVGGGVGSYTGDFDR